jgi:signal transduction histidine kinase
MNVITAIKLFCVVINLFVIFVVLLRSQKTKGQYLFALLVSVVSAWSIELIIIYNNIPNALVQILSRMAFSTVLILVYLLFSFTYYFPQKIKFLKERYLLLFSIPIVVLVAISELGGVVSSVSLRKSVFISHIGQYYYVYFLAIVLYVGLSIFNLTYNYLTSKGIQKIQLYFLLLGFGITSLLALISNLILPTFGVYEFNNLGASFAVILDIFVLYTIVRHRFLGIKLVVGNIVYIICLAAFVNISFFLTISFESKLFGSIFTSGAYALDVCISILFTIAFVYFNNRLVLLNRIYSGIEGQNHAIESLREITINSLELESSLEKVMIYIKDIIKVDHIYVVAKSGEDRYVYCHNKELHNFLNERFDELRNIFTGETDVYVTLEKREESVFNFPYEIFAQSKVVMAINVVVYQDDDVIFLLENEDFEDTVFDTEEVKFLQNVFKEVAFFINRAMLHQKVISFNKNLQQEVSEATNELKEKNVALQKAYEDVNETARKERDMLDIMGHELRTPATVVKMASYLLDKRVTDENGKKQIERIKDSIERQIRLINTFINTSKIDNNKMALSLEPIHLDEMVRKAVDDHHEEAVNKQLTLDFEGEEQMPFVLADTARIREVIDNLITNAIKYTASGYIKVRTHVDNNEVIVDVEDSGEGIKPEDQTYLFKKFKRLRNYTATSGEGNVKMIRPGGTGLGLYVSKEIVEMHKGRIMVESEYGKGSTFSFALPIASDEDVAKYGSKQGGSANLFSRLNLTNAHE